MAILFSPAVEEYFAAKLHDKIKVTTTICVYCGMSFTFPANSSAQNIESIHNVLKDHDTVCAKNPLVQKLKERDDLISRAAPLRWVYSSDGRVAQEAADWEKEAAELIKK